MRKFISLLLAVSFMGINCATYQRGEGINLEPGQKPGANVEIYKTKSKMEGTSWETPDIKGELIAVKENSLLLLDSRGVDSSVDINELYAIRIAKKSKALIGFCIGFVAPAASWAAMGANIDDGLYALYSVIIGFPSAVLGAIIGGRLSRDNIYLIAGKSDEEIKEILEDLRKKARVPDFQ
jgi:hypothetical protein